MDEATRELTPEERLAVAALVRERVGRSVGELRAWAHEAMPELPDERPELRRRARDGHLKVNAYDPDGAVAERNWRIFCAWWHGGTLREAGRAHGISTERARQIVARTARHIALAQIMAERVRVGCTPE